MSGPPIGKMMINQIQSMFRFARMTCRMHAIFAASSISVGMGYAWKKSMLRPATQTGATATASSEPTDDAVEPPMNTDEITAVLGETDRGKMVFSRPFGLQLLGCVLRPDTNRRTFYA